MERAAVELLAYLERNGYAAYQVGGCVRDRLLGYPISDIDIATSAKPDELMSLFPRAIPTGAKHGTVTVLWDEYAFEVTTFRKDGDYKDRRRPAEVEFVDDIVLDLARRDFTINAMAMDRYGRLIDPFGGQSDLECRVLRSVGEPRKRFAEDALRILRALRFSARFRLTIEEQTWRALNDLSSSLALISRERIRDELTKMIGGRHPNRGLKLLATPNLLPFEDLSALFREKTIKQMPANFETLSARGRWVALFALAKWDLEKTARFLSDWKFSRRESRVLLDLLALTQKISEAKDETQAKRLLLRGGFEQTLEAVAIQRWLERESNVATLNPDWWRRLNEQIRIRDVRQLAVDGRALLDFFKRAPGPWIGAILDELFEEVALRGLPNERQHLLEAARKVLNEIEGTNIDHF